MEWTMGSGVASGLTVTLIAVAVLAILDVWVYRDARARANNDEPVAVELGSLMIDTPRAWAAFCAVLFVIFFPLYLVARKTTG
jgi:hypothetical protein